jgi:hypothetical protein
VLATINFHNQARLKTYEIRDVRTDRHLPPERYFLESMRSEAMPEATFGFRHVASKRTRA